jgi:plastocyanin
MRIYRILAVLTSLFVLPLFLNLGIIGKDTKKKAKNDVCSASNPASICAAENTCGSASSPCSIDIRRSEGSSASATPSMPGAKSNKAFCIKTGTTVTFTSSSKDTGFVLDFGNANPFDHPGAIMGGADRPITVTAKHAGCYTYSVGACTAGTVYGMCGDDVAQLIISDK